MSRRAAALWSAAGLLAGLALGSLGAFLQAARSVVLGVSVPWGTVLMVVSLVLVIRGAIDVSHSRWAGWCTFAGWLIATIVFASPMPWGAVVITAGGRQMAYLTGCVIAGAAAAALPPLSSLRRSHR